MRDERQRLRSASGEYADVVVPIRRPYAYPTRSFFTVSDEIVALKPYKPTALDLMLFLDLMPTHSAGVFLPVVIKDTAEKFETFPANISRSLAFLVDVAALLKDAKRHGKSYAYMANPRLVYKGPSELHHVVYQEYGKMLPDPASVRRKPRTTKSRATSPEGASS